MLNWQPPMAAKAQSSELSFEKAMTRLEAIVEEMESGKMLLEDLLVRYEEGMKLVKVCQERLARAEEKIEIITRDHAGKVAVKNFETAEAPGATVAGNAIERKENDDVSLF
jgi:exodeoxyribonuclease VII small subunit